jgi:hypothetical protein
MTNELIELASKLRSSIELVSREVTGSTSDNVMGLLCVAGDAAAMLRKMTEQKPVATVDADADGFLHFESDFPFAQGRHLLYAAPVAVAEQKPVALSDDAIAARCSQLDSVRSLPNRCDDDVWPAVERALLDVARLYAAPVAAITAEQKPVAWAQVVHDKVWAVFKYKGDAERYLEKVHVDAVVKPLYAAPVPAITQSPNYTVSGGTLNTAPAQPVKRIMLMRLRAGGLWTQITEEYPHPYDDYEYAWATIERLDQNAVSA